jgi:Cu+-exporting ATPase
MSTTASPSATPSVTPERNPEPGKAALRKVRLDVGGMHCAGCVARVEALLGSQPQVASASVNLALERAEVQVSGDGTDEALAAVLTDAGFPSQLRGDERARELQALAVDIDGMSCAACVGTRFWRRPPLPAIPHTCAAALLRPKHRRGIASWPGCCSPPCSLCHWWCRWG